MDRNTSVSDNGAYPEFCYMASKHDEVFRIFKMHPNYRRIVDFDPESGKGFLEVILRDRILKVDINIWGKFLEQDKLGNPQIIKYNLGGLSIQISPTTLGYMKVLSDIIRLFDTDKIKKIAEIGVGYAGQYQILTTVLPIEEYNLIDLPEVLALAERCVNELNPHRGGVVRYIDGTHLYMDVESDLFISNYAFSELNRKVQDVYIEKVLSKAKAGYITWNDGDEIPRWNSGTYRLNEILPMLPNAKIIPEEPLLHSGNCIIVWGTK